MAHAVWAACCVWLQDHANEVLAETSELTDGLRTSVILAREYLKDVRIAPEQVGTLHYIFRGLY